MPELRSTISLDNEGAEHVTAIFSKDKDVVIVKHTKFNKNIHKPIEVPVSILSEICYVLRDTNQYLKPRVKSSKNEEVK